MEFQPDTFTEYYYEKLAIRDKNEALRIINLWNQKIIQKVSFIKIFKIRNIRFGLLRDPGSGRMIVMVDRAIHPKNMHHIKAGRGGYLWQYLPNSKLHMNAATQELLNNRLCLRSKYDQDRFIKL